MQVQVPEIAVKHIVDLVADDVKATLGPGHEEQVLDTALKVKSSIENDPGVDQASFLDLYFDRVVTGVQQHIQAHSAGAPWPPCPKHADHPLRLVDDHWTCPLDGNAHCRLGELAGHTTAPTGPRRAADPMDLLKEFHAFCESAGVDPEHDAPDRVIEMMLAFYSEVRVSGCDPGNDEDMLLVDWGSYDLGKGRAYELDLSRQVDLTHRERGGIWALHLFYRFPITPALADVPAGNDWWASPRNVREFRSAIQHRAALDSALGAKPLSVEIYFERAD